MIYIGFLIDYIISFFLPFNSYFLIFDVDNNNFFYVVMVGIILDILYWNFGIYLFLLLIFYFFSKMFCFNNRFHFFKNLILYFIFFNVTYFINGFYFPDYFYYLLSGMFLQVVYYKLVKVFFY